MQFLLRILEDHGQEGKLRAVAQTGELLQGLLGLDRQAAQLADHEVDDVVRVPLGVNATQVPGPARRAMIEREQSFLGQRRKKLNRKERIAGRLLVHQLRQRGRALLFAVERIRNQPPHVFAGEGRQDDLLHERSRLTDRIEFAPQRMRGHRLRCRDRRRSASGAAHPVESTGLRCRSKVAASSHCKSSRKSASGCSGRANTPRKRRNTS